LLGAAPLDPRAAARSSGTDRATAYRVAQSLLAQPLPAQLHKVRCEVLGAHRICGLTIAGTKFHHPLDRRAFTAEVAQLVRGAFAAAPLEEVDVWATVPLDAGRGAIVSGDLAVATSATVFAVTVPRAHLAGLGAQLASNRDVYWDAEFAADLAKGKAR
jgi:hypothetical protein